MPRLSVPSIGGGRKVMRTPASLEGGGSSWANVPAVRSAASARTDAGNPKFEIRNPKQTGKNESEILENRFAYVTGAAAVFRVPTFRICFGFRLSDFEFTLRIVAPV